MSFFFSFLILLAISPFASSFLLRDSLGLDLRGSVVILDEAHNIIETVSSVHSAQVTGQQVKQAGEAVGQYLDK